MKTLLSNSQGNTVCSPRCHMWPLSPLAAHISQPRALPKVTAAWPTTEHKEPPPDSAAALCIRQPAAVHLVLPPNTRPSVPVPVIVGGSVDRHQSPHVHTPVLPLLPSRLLPRPSDSPAPTRHVPPPGLTPPAHSHTTLCWQPQPTPSPLPPTVVSRPRAHSPPNQQAPEAMQCRRRCCCRPRQRARCPGQLWRATVPVAQPGPPLLAVWR